MTKILWWMSSSSVVLFMPLLCTNLPHVGSRQSLWVYLNLCLLNSWYRVKYCNCVGLSGTGSGIGYSSSLNCLPLLPSPTQKQDPCSTLSPLPNSSLTLVGGDGCSLQHTLWHVYNHARACSADTSWHRIRPLAVFSGTNPKKGNADTRKYHDVVQALWFFCRTFPTEDSSCCSV